MSNYQTVTKGRNFLFYGLFDITTNGASDFTGTLEFQLYDNPNSANLCLNGATGTGFSDSFSVSFPPSLAFNSDLSTSNGWVTVGAPSPSNYLYFNFLRGTQITQYGIASYPTATSTATRSFKSWVLRGSYNGDNWIEIDRRSNESGWTLGELRKYLIT